MDFIDFLAQKAHAEAVIGGDEAHVVQIADKRLDPSFHFLRRLIGKSNAEYIGRIDAEPVHNVGEARGQRLGLSRSCAGDDAHIALSGLYRPQLFWIKVF